MDISEAPDLVQFWTRRYRNHILVFCIVLFLGLTFAHPAIIITDDWITANQLHQLHEGHQIIINEGKYGTYENGTLNEYFVARGNLLGYSLFLPILSLPASWLIDIFGQHFVFFILYLWTALALALTLYLHFHSRQAAGSHKWYFTSAMIGLVLILFFINLFFYIPFPVSGFDSSPEVMAIVFTNIIFLAFTAVMVYEINRTLFEDPFFSLFCSAVCLVSSSYFFWTTGCKDHLLALLIFTGILVSLVKFQKKNDDWFFVLAFLITGLLAWARPELALWVFLTLCAFCGYTIAARLQDNPGTSVLRLVSAPFFTLLGALPFFLNNYLITKNPLLPTGAIYLSEESAGIVVHASQNSLGGNVPDISPLQVLTIKNPVPSSDIVGDILGILFHPQNGSMGVLPLTPLFLVMVLIAAIFIFQRKMQFSREEKTMMSLLAIVALAVFLAYANNLPQLNTSRGITPDMRYLLPIYLPMNLIGLIILKKIPGFFERPAYLLNTMILFSCLAISLSVILMSFAYANTVIAENLNAPLTSFFTVLIFFVAALTLIICLWDLRKDQRTICPLIMVALLCAIPFIWQIDASVYAWQFATAEGYPPWIPVTRTLYYALSFPLMP